MRFLKQAAETRRKRVKLEDLLLMILRCLALVAVVLALARPWWGADPGSLKLVKDVALVIDNSPSMEIDDAFGRAVSQAVELVEGSPQGSAFSLVAGKTAVLASPVVNHYGGAGCTGEAEIGIDHVSRLRRARCCRGYARRRQEWAPTRDRGVYRRAIPRVEVRCAR